jgi:hypothetical protein
MKTREGVRLHVSHKVTTNRVQGARVDQSGDISPRPSGEATGSTTETSDRILNLEFYDASENRFHVTDETHVEIRVHHSPKTVAQMDLNRGKPMLFEGRPVLVSEEVADDVTRQEPKIERRLLTPTQLTNLFIECYATMPESTKNLLQQCAEEAEESKPAELSEPKEPVAHVVSESIQAVRVPSASPLVVMSRAPAVQESQEEESDDADDDEEEFDETDERLQEKIMEAVDDKFSKLEDQITERLDELQKNIDEKFEEAGSEGNDGENVNDLADLWATWRVIQSFEPQFRGRIQKQGFCPYCKKKCRNLSNLLKHYESSHFEPESEEEE